MLKLIYIRLEGVKIIYCKHCGIKLKNKRLYCPECGKRIEVCDENDNFHFYHKPKSRITAGLIAIILGFGIYNLYLKKIKKGMIQFFVPFASILAIIIMTIICSFISNYKIIIYGFFLPLFFATIITVVMHLWCIIEGVLILIGFISEDGHGRPLN